MTTFDEAARLSLYSDDQLDRLASAASATADPSEADPAALLGMAFAAAARRDRVTRAMVADILTYLPGDLLVKVDLASMAHSLECRGPFLDHRVVELAAAMPLGRKLRLRARAAPRSCSSRRSPTCCRPRSGPARRWASASRSADGSATS